MLEDRVELPRLYIAWHSPALFADGDAELDLVADVLSSGKTSRLYRALVYEQRIATEVAASQNSREAGSFFQIVATAAPGPDARRGRARDRAGAGRPRSNAVRRADEMERCLAQAEAHFLFRLQTVGGFGGKSDQLNAYNMFLGDPGYFERDLERYRGATPTRCAAPPRAGCIPRQRVVLSVVPRGRSGAGARRLAAGGGVVMTADRIPPAGARARAPLHASRRSVAPTLATACACWTVEHRQVPLVSVLLLVPGGRVRRSGRSPGPGRDHRRHARRRLRRSFGARRARSAGPHRRAARHRRRRTTPPSSA